MTHLEQIRQACIKANSEIVELKFGCEFRYFEGLNRYGHRRTPTVKYLCLNTQDEIVAYLVSPANTRLEIKKDDIEEILGRPIRLADVLLAISKADENNHNKIWMKSDGRIVANFETKSLKSVVDWDLLKDDLTQQSETTIDFIHSILFNHHA